MFSLFAGSCPARAMSHRAMIAIGFSLLAGPALAGGYDTGERDWDFMFQQDRVAVEASVRYIHPDRTLSNISGALYGASIDAKEAEAFTIPRYGVAAKLDDHLRCLASYREPWGGHANYGTAWSYTASAVEQHFSSKDYGLTCALSAPLGIGTVSMLGGASRQEIKYELSQILTPPLAIAATPALTKVSDANLGWRTGLAFEIPEYALRVSLIYNSAIDYDMTGTYTVTGVGTSPVFGSITMPQSVELKAQSGVAPGWLAFGSIKWTDWSVARKMPICVVGTGPCFYGAGGQVSGLALLFKDSWTITAGLAHPFSEHLSVAGSLTWDQGASEGFTSQTDTWVASLNAVITPHENFQINLGGSVGLMTGGSLNTTSIDGFANLVGYTATFGDDLVYTLSASAVYRY